MTNLLFKVLNFDDLERWVKYKVITLGSDGIEFKAFC